jgi:hypothetical protein
MNKTDFLNAICGKAVKRTIEGIEVEVKSLTVLEVQQIQAIKDPFEQSLQMVLVGLINPKLDKEDMETLKKAQAGFIGKLAKEITKVSGLDSDSNESPTVGNG